ncbi:hypothetical protein ACFZC7_35375 [Streptomyces massasporeus]|uniref:DNA polymerase Y family protein n=1 Tax=Streptomyces massasporeus TaxID=67324 RepID=UPI0036E4C3DF
MRCPDRLGEETYRQVLEQLADLSPIVQALPPSAALVELKGALRYHGTDARHLAEVLRVRTISRLGVDGRVGIGPSITVAATASAQIQVPGGVLAIDPDQALAWLATLPVEALHGIGPRQAEALHDYGVHNVGLLAAIPPATVQRLLGGRAGRLAADRARGIDPRPVVPRTLPASAIVRTAFPRHTLDGAEVRAALLNTVVRLALLLRRRGQAARALTLTLKFAGGSTWTKTRRLAEPSHHDDDLRTVAYQLMDAAGLQRGRLTDLTLKAEDLLLTRSPSRSASTPPARPAWWPKPLSTACATSTGPTSSARPPPFATPHDPALTGCSPTRPTAAAGHPDPGHHRLARRRMGRGHGPSKAQRPPHTKSRHHEVVPAPGGHRAATRCREVPVWLLDGVSDAVGRCPPTRRPRSARPAAGSDPPVSGHGGYGDGVRLEHGACLRLASLRPRWPGSRVDQVLRRDDGWNGAAAAPGHESRSRFFSRRVNDHGLSLL